MSQPISPSLSSCSVSSPALPQYLLSVDPGKVSGICLVEIMCGEPTILWSTELDFIESCDLINKTMLEFGQQLRVVCESFVITPQTGKNSQAPFSIELIGVIKWLSAAYNADSLVFQSPQKAKNFCPNDRLKRVGFWHVGGEGHARDALRHAVTHLVDCGWIHEKLLAK